MARKQIQKDRPPWFAQAVVLLKAWQTRGLVARLEDLHWSRPSKQFVALDLVLVLLLLALSNAKGVRPFYRQLGDFGPELAALWGRSRLPTRSGFVALLRAVDPSLVDHLHDLFADDLDSLLAHSCLVGILDHGNRPWTFVDLDPTRQASLLHSTAEDPTRPPARAPRADSTAPGYAGRKRADAVRTRTAALLTHLGLWAWTAGAPGNGQRLPGLTAACSRLAALRDRRGPGAPWVVRTDGEFGSLAYLSVLARQGLHFLTRGKDYRTVFAWPAVQAVLKAGPQSTLQVTDSPLVREVFESAQVTWTEAERPPLTLRVVIARSRLPPGQTRPKVGHLHEGWVYEVFLTDLPAHAFSPADLVGLYLGRGHLEKALAEEDRELPTDRWITHRGPGEDLFQILCQWVWNHRVVLGANLSQEPTPRRTRWDVSVSACPPAPMLNLPDGVPESAPSPPAQEPPTQPEPSPSAQEPSAQEPSAQEPSAQEPSAQEPSAQEPSAQEPSAQEPSAQEPSAQEPSAQEPPTQPAPRSPAVVAPGTTFTQADFQRDAQGTVRCPAGQPMRQTELRARRAGPRGRYQAPRAACATCVLTQACRGTADPLRKGRQVDLPLRESESSAVEPAPPRPPDAAPGPRGRRVLPVLQRAVLWWLDVPAAAQRRAWDEALTSAHVEVRVEPDTPRPPEVTRDTRAHRRRTWQARLTVNRRSPDAPPLTLFVSGVPVALARATGLDLDEVSSDSQPRGAAA